MFTFFFLETENYHCFCAKHTFLVVTVLSALKNFTVNVLMLSAETSFTSLTGFSSVGVYSTIRVGTEVSKGTSELGRRFSISPRMSLTDIWLDGIVVGESIPSVIWQIGVVVLTISAKITNPSKTHVLELNS